VVDSAGRTWVDEATRRLRDGWTRAFQTFSGAQLAHAAGDAALAVALANTLFFSVPLGEARGKVLLYLVLTILPFAVIAPLLGRLVDAVRIGTRRVLIAAAIVRVIAAVLLMTRTESWMLFPLALILLIASRAHGITRVATVPEVVPPTKTVMWANTWLAVISSAGAAVGAALSVGVVQLWGSAGGLAVSALAYLTVAVLIILLQRSPSVRVSHESHSGEIGPVPLPVLAAGTGVIVMRLIVGYVTFFLAFVLKSEYSTTALGIAILAAGIGGALGSLVAMATRRWLPQWILPAAMLVPVAVVTLVNVERFTLGAAAVLAGTVGLAATAARLGFDSELQHSADPRQRGRLITRYETLFQLAWIAGAVASLPPLGTRGGVLLLLVIVVVGAFVVVRHLLRDHRGGAHGGGSA
jgi:predicted MFS family arabinose efflux permease